MANRASAPLPQNVSKKADIILISHTHWDREWHDTFEEFRHRLVRCCEFLLSLIERDARFKNFMFDGQTVVLEDILEIKPELENPIRKVIQGGRILVGPWYVLPDQYIVSGESLVRNLMLGHKVAGRFGPVMKDGEIPDTFGHIAQLPQILQGFNIPNFFFARGLGNQFEDLGIDFWWDAPDGSRVFAHNYLGGYGNISGPLRSTNTDPAVALSENIAHTGKVLGAIFHELPHAPTDTVLLMNGVDQDFPQPSLPAFVEYFNSSDEIKEEGDFRASQGTLREYQDVVLKKLSDQGKELPVYHGELREGRFQPNLLGVGTTRMYLKLANWQCETWLPLYTEPLCAQASLVLSTNDRQDPYPRDFLDHAWKLLVKNHPHDSIGGAAIDPVHREMEVRFASCQQLIKRLQCHAFIGIFKTTGITLEFNTLNAAAVYNPLPWVREQEFSFETNFVVPPDAPETLQPAVFTGDGDGVSCMIHEIREKRSPRKTSQVRSYSIKGRFKIPPTGVIFLLLSVRSKDLARHPPQESPPSKVFYRHPDILENKSLRVRVQEDGRVEICHKTSGAVFGGLCELEDREDAGDEYDWGPLDPPAPVIYSRGTPARINLHEKTPWGLTLRVEQTIRVPTSLVPDYTGRQAETVTLPVTTFVTLNDDEEFVRFHAIINNTAEDHRLRVLFPLPFTPENHVAGGHFQDIERHITIPDDRQWVQKYNPCYNHKGWVTAMNPKGGPTLAIFDRGLPEYEVIQGEGTSRVALTLFRSTRWLGNIIPGHESRGLPGPHIHTPEAQCKRLMMFDYAIFPFSGDWLPANVAKLAQDFCCPFEAEAWDLRRMLDPAGASINIREDRKVLKSFLHFEQDAWILSAIKKSESGDRFIIRFYSVAREITRGIIRFGLLVKDAGLLNLNEEPAEPQTNVRILGTMKDIIELEVGPAKIVTIGVLF